MYSPTPRPARGPGKQSLPLEERLADEARFLRSWFDKPLVTGAVSPSGRFLARTMARYIDPQGKGPIIELGPGTGPITEALLQRGIAASRLVLIEFDADFCKLLRRRFPGTRIIQADAYRLAESLRGALNEPADAIVSSLPLLTKPEKQRLALLRDAFGLMAEDGRFVQFTYGRASPMPRNQTGLVFHAEVSPAVWLNLPPARVWVYRRGVDTVPVSAAETASKDASPAQDFFDRLRLGTEKMQNDLRKEIAAAKARLQRPKAEARKRARAKSNVGLLRAACDREKSPRP